jgi:hypothetical protein
LPDPAAVDPQLRQRLSEREAELRAAEDARAAGEHGEGKSGVIVDNEVDNLFLGPKTTKLAARMTLRMTHVPTAVVHLLDAGSNGDEGNPLLSCTVKNVSDDIRRLRVSSFVDGYAASAVDTIEIAERGAHTFHQLPVFRAEALRHLTEITRATLNVLVEDLDSGKVELHRTQPIWMLPPTSAPLYVQDPATGSWRDMTAWFGAFVTPNAPEVMSFLRAAADHHDSHTLAGYQGDESAVEPQTRAIFDALKTVGIVYVNSVLTSSAEDGVTNQRVRLPREALADRQANCIDGTVLYASLLEGISMNPAIVIVPGHALVAWETWRRSGKWAFLETTMTGTHSYEQARAAGEATAAQYEVATGPARTDVHLWSLRVLRTERGITPMA